MNEPDEQQIVKTVGSNRTPLAASVNLVLMFKDASCYGELSSQDGHSRKHGVRLWRVIWPVHVKCMSCNNDRQPDEKRMVAKMKTVHSRWPTIPP